MISFIEIQQTLKLEGKGVIQKHVCLKLWPKSLHTVCNNSGTYLHNPMNLRDRWNKQKEFKIRQGISGPYFKVFVLTK